MSRVMSDEEQYDLEHQMLFHHSHELEFKVREAAKNAAERSVRTRGPWIVLFAEPIRAAFRDPIRFLPTETRALQIVVDVRHARDDQTATLLAEEQIRRQLRDHAWARLPDLSGTP